jgi:hypothetical protein
MFASRSVSPVAIVVLALSCLIAGLLLAAPARAQAQHEAICKTFPGSKVEAGAQAFMTEQLGAGKTNFVSPVGYVLCAW